MWAPISRYTSPKQLCRALFYKKNSVGLVNVAGIRNCWRILTGLTKPCYQLSGGKALIETKCVKLVLIPYER